MRLDIQISDAIMSFQETGLRVTQKVFEICGTPKSPTSSRGRPRFSRALSNEDFETHVSDVPKMDPSPSQRDLVKSSQSTRKSEFEKLIADIKTMSQDSMGFWRHLPYVMCDQPDHAFQERLFGKAASKPSDNDQCWNGVDSGPYRADIVQDGLAHLLKNPEIIIRTPLIEPSLLKDQSMKLTTITTQIKSAHVGNEVKWWDEEIMIDDEEYEGSGSGDGSDEILCGESDDEDFYDGSGDAEGSGHGCPSDLNSDTESSSWTPWTPPTTSTTRSTTTQTTTTTTRTSTTTAKPTYKGGSPDVSASLGLVSMSLLVILASSPWAAL